MDFKTEAGFQKFIIGIISVIGTILINVMGWSPDKTSVIITTLTQFAPMIAGFLFFIVNQYAAKGKANTEIAKMQVANGQTPTALLTKLAKVSPDAALVVLANEAKALEVTPEPPPRIPSVKEKINAMQKIVATYEGCKQYFLSSLAERVEFWKAKMVAMYPNIPNWEQLQKAIEQITGMKLDEIGCDAINAMRGLPALMHAKSDWSITMSFFAAYEAGKITLDSPAMQTFFIAASQRSATEIVEEASARVRNDKLPMVERQAALMEFGISASDAANMSASGGSVSLKIAVDPNDFSQGWSYRPFDPYTLAGIPPAPQEN